MIHLNVLVAMSVDGDTFDQLGNFRKLNIFQAKAYRRPFSQSIIIKVGLDY